MGTRQTVVALNLPIWEYPPFYKEVKRVDSELKDGYAARVYGVPAEQLKAGGYCMMLSLCAIILQV